MRLFTALLVFLIVASGLPVCRCVDHGGEACRPIGATESASPSSASCCAGEGDESRGDEGAPASGCCCIDAPPADPSAAPPAGLATTDEGPLSREIAAFFIAPRPLSLGGSIVSDRGFGSARASIRSAPFVPLYRLHAALLI